MDSRAYTGIVKLVRIMASRWGKEATKRPDPGETTGRIVWRFSQGPNDPEHSQYDNPLFWRLDTWLGGVNAHCTFELNEPLTAETIEARFLAMEVCREESLKIGNS